MTSFDETLAADARFAQGFEFQVSDPKKAIASYEKGRAMYEALAKAHSTETEYQSELAYTHKILGDLFREMDRRLEAEVSYQEALTIREALTKAHPTVPEYQSNLANTHENLGFFLGATGRTEEAKVSFQDAEAIRAKIR